MAITQVGSGFSVSQPFVSPRGNAWAHNTTPAASTGQNLPPAFAQSSAAQTSMTSLSSVSTSLQASFRLNQVFAQQTAVNPDSAGNARRVGLETVDSQSLAVNLNLSLNFSSLQMSSNTFQNMPSAQMGTRLRGAGQQVGQMLNASVSGFSFRIGINMSIASKHTSNMNEVAQQIDDLQLDPATKKMLGGYLALLESLMNDDEKLGQFIKQIKQTLGGLVQGLSNVGSAPSAGEYSGEQPATTMTQSQALNLNIEVNIHGQIIQINALNGQAVQEADPIVLDLTGDGINLTSVHDGVDFDITGDGKKERTAFVTGGDGFLVWDRNGNGIIDSGRELFGDQHGAINGFEELRKFDDNNDGVIDAKDKIFDQLRVWVEKNGDGISQPEELYKLDELNIKSIKLNAKDTNIMTSSGNRITQIASYTRQDGTQHLAADVMLNYLA